MADVSDATRMAGACTACGQQTSILYVVGDDKFCESCHVARGGRVFKPGRYLVSIEVYDNATKGMLVDEGFNTDSPESIRHALRAALARLTEIREETT